jgi:hypothetical protein
MGNPLVYIPK